MLKLSRLHKKQFSFLRDEFLEVTKNRLKEFKNGKECLIENDTYYWASEDFRGNLNKNEEMTDFEIEYISLLENLIKIHERELIQAQAVESIGIKAMHSEINKQKFDCEMKLD